jgi:hypothetical protein
MRRNKPPGVRPIEPVRHPCSSNHGIVLFVGDAQSGKSATLNFLFGSGNKEISPVNQGEGTNDIIEFRSTNPVDNLRVIDTPGLGSPDNLEWDAQIMASLKKFLDMDIELSRFIPHAVIIVTRFDAPEASFGHPESTFVKTLKTINLLRARLLDEYHSNVIVVLTHFMSGRQRYRLVPQPIFDKVKSLVRLHLNVPYDPHIVVAENQAERIGLAQIGNNFQLTNGDFYPENLHGALLSVAGTSKSLIGYEYFYNVLKQNHRLSFETPKIVNMVDPERTRYRKFLRAIILASASSSV